jgi:hypothetical protein
MPRRQEIPIGFMAVEMHHVPARRLSSVWGMHITRDYTHVSTPLGWGSRPLVFLAQYPGQTCLHVMYIQGTDDQYICDLLHDGNGGRLWPLGRFSVSYTTFASVLTKQSNTHCGHVSPRYTRWAKNVDVEWFRFERRMVAMHCLCKACVGGWNELPHWITQHALLFVGGLRAESPFLPHSCRISKWVQNLSLVCIHVTTMGQGVLFRTHRNEAVIAKFDHGLVYPLLCTNPH